MSDLRNATTQRITSTGSRRSREIKKKGLLIDIITYDMRILNMFYYCVLRGKHFALRVKIVFYEEGFCFERLQLYILYVDFFDNEM